jgi:replicative DNA helicase
LNCVPQQNLEAEMSALGSALLDARGYSAVREYLEPGDFYRPNHQTIYEALIALRERGGEVDNITLQEELRSMGKLEECGGQEYIMALVDSVPTTANATYYAKIVLRHSQLRKQQAAAVEVLGQLSQADCDPRGVSAWLLDKLNDIAAHDTAGLTRVSASMGPYLNTLRDRAEEVSASLYSLGLPTMEAETQRWGQPRFYVLKGKRGSGKTHFAIHACMSCLAKGRGAAFFSLEMSEEQVLDRCIAYRTGLNTKALQHLKDPERWAAVANAAGELFEEPLFICDQGQIPVSQMQAYCSALRSQGQDIGLIAADYAELIKPPPKCDNREQELSEVAKQLKALCKDIGCTVLLLSQVNKEGIERGSEGIGNAADHLMTIHKENGFTLNSDKNRFGEGFTITLNLDPGTSRISERAEVDEQEAPKGGRHEERHFWQDQ